MHTCLSTKLASNVAAAYISRRSKRLLKFHNLLAQKKEPSRHTISEQRCYNVIITSMQTLFQHRVPAGNSRNGFYFLLFFNLK